MFQHSFNYVPEKFQTLTNNIKYHTSVSKQRHNEDPNSSPKTRDKLRQQVPSKVSSFNNGSTNRLWLKQLNFGLVGKRRLGPHRSGLPRSSVVLLWNYRAQFPSRRTASMDYTHIDTVLIWKHEAALRLVSAIKQY